MSWFGVPSLHHLHEACVLHLMHEVPWFHCELVWVPSLHHLHEACESRLMHEVPWFHCELVWVPSLHHLHEACVFAPDA